MSHTFGTNTTYITNNSSPAPRSASSGSDDVVIASGGSVGTSCGGSINPTITLQQEEFYRHNLAAAFGTTTSSNNSSSSTSSSSGKNNSNNAISNGHASVTTAPHAVEPSPFSWPISAMQNTLVPTIASDYGSPTTSAGPSGIGPPVETSKTPVGAWSAGASLGHQPTPAGVALVQVGSEPQHGQQRQQWFGESATNVVPMPQQVAIPVPQPHIPQQQFLFPAHHGVIPAAGAAVNVAAPSSPFGLNPSVSTAQPTLVGMVDPSITAAASSSAFGGVSPALTAPPQGYPGVVVAVPNNLGPFAGPSLVGDLGGFTIAGAVPDNKLLTPTSLMFEQQQQQQHAEGAPVFTVQTPAAGLLAATSGMPAGSPQMTMHPSSAVAATAAVAASMAGAVAEPAPIPFPPTAFLQLNPLYPGLRKLVECPPLYIVDDFFTASECDALMVLADNYMVVSPVVGAGAGEISESRTSSSCFLAREDLPTVCNKVMALTGKPLEHLELPQVGRYYTSQKYANHWDAFDLTTEDGRRFAQNGGQRVCTVLVYLNDVASGGCTSFPRLGLTVQPRKGMAVVFFPATLDGALDPMLLHAAEPAMDTKWVSQIWIRQGTYHGTPSARIPRI